jgi:hypothetical protein
MCDETVSPALSIPHMPCTLLPMSNLLDKFLSLGSKNANDVCLEQEKMRERERERERER